MASISLKDRNILVTGAARGLGRAMTLALIRAGAKVAAVDLDSSKEHFDSLQTELDQDGIGDRLECMSADLRQARSCDELIQHAIDRCGGLHGLVNNAGIGMQGFGAVLVGEKPKFYEIAATDWENVLQTNVNAAFFLSRAATRVFIKQQYGKLVNITTSFRTMQQIGFSPYGPSKAALEAATVIWAKDLAGSGVTANVLLPGGAANTRMIPQNEITDRTRLVQPEAMGAPIVWLMSSHSDGVSGLRFIAAEWDQDIPADQIAASKGSPAGW